MNRFLNFNLSFAFLLLTFHVTAQQKVKEQVINFDFDQFAIKSQYTKAISSIADMVSKDPSLYVEVSGHADSSGKKAYNDKLSLKRTETVIKELMKQKVAQSQLKGFHYGSTKPIASNATKAGRDKNRRVEIAVFSNKALAPVLSKQEPKSDEIPATVVKVEEMPLRTQIDVFYNQASFAYLNNQNRTIVHTVNNAEMIFDTNTFALPASNLYRNYKVRLDFKEVYKKGEMLSNKLSLKVANDQMLDASYIMCLDFSTFKMGKDKTIDFLIPEGFVKGGMQLYYSDNRTNWEKRDMAKFEKLHGSYTIKMKQDGCFALGNLIKEEKPVALIGTYKTKKIQGEEEPEFYFVYKNNNTIVAADSVGNGKFYFNGVKNGALGSIVGIVKNDGNSMLLAKEEIVIKANQSNLVHSQGNVKFASINHFEMEAALLNIK
jgi:hypothetical protein